MEREGRCLPEQDGHKTECGRANVCVSVHKLILGHQSVYATKATDDPWCGSSDGYFDFDDSRKSEHGSTRSFFVGEMRCGRETEVG